MINEYKSSDFNIVCYLLANGLVFKRLIDNGASQRITFLLEVPEQVSLEVLLKKWDDSNEAETIRRFAHYSKFLRGELKRYFENSK